MKENSILKRVVGKLRREDDSAEAESKFFGGVGMDADKGDLKRWSNLTDTRNADTKDSATSATASGEVDRKMADVISIDKDKETKTEKPEMEDAMEDVA